VCVCVFHGDLTAQKRGPYSSEKCVCVRVCVCACVVSVLCVCAVSVGNVAASGVYPDVRDTLYCLSQTLQSTAKTEADVYSTLLKLWRRVCTPTSCLHRACAQWYRACDHVHDYCNEQVHRAQCVYKTCQIILLNCRMRCILLFVCVCFHCPYIL
jgi:hypothetical protein